MQIRCPHCHDPIELVNDDPWNDVSCPSCGSCFNLARDSETAQDDGTHGKKLGHFHLLHCLGQGAFGSVWKARDTELDRLVAIKIPRREQLTEADAEKFLREARAAAQVRHPNIVSVHEVGREDGRIYIASDYIDGASLDQWIEAHPLTVRESVELCAKIAEALHHAHEAGIVHRDLKPQNILVSRLGLRPDPGSNSNSDKEAGRDRVPTYDSLTPFITDFGLAKREVGEITMTIEGAILGTPSYMPPEQARGEGHQADRRSDVYSLGVVLFRLLTGELPFRGQRQMLILQILTEEPPALRKLEARIPRDVETICLKCLEKEPTRRYQSAAALAADLRRWLTGHPIEARPVSRTERAWRWCHRNPAIASLSAAVVFVLLTGMAVSAFFAFQSAARNRDLLKETARANQKADEALANADEARRHLYSAHMNLAQRNWEISQVGLVLDSLEEVRPQSGAADLRGFEWHYWDRLCHSALLDLKGHTGVVTSVAFSADGKRLASADRDGTVKVWDTTNGQEKLSLQAHTHAVASVAFSGDGKRLASASFDETAKVWDALSGQEVLHLKGHTNTVTCVTFSHDGNRLASGSVDQTVRMWDAASGQETHRLKGHEATVTSVAFRADGQRLESASSDGTVKEWHLTRMRPAGDGEELPTFPHGTKLLHLGVGHVTSLAVSADGSRQALAVYDGAARTVDTVKVWDASIRPETVEETLTLNGPTGRVRSMAFRTDGKRLASAGGDQTVKVWDTANGRESLTLKGHTDEITSVVFSADGKRLASASYDRTVKVWDATSGHEPLTLKGNTDSIWSVAFSADGKRLASANRNRTLSVWDSLSGQELLTLKEDVYSAVFSPDGKRLVSANRDGTLKVWDSMSGQELLTLKGHTGQVKKVAVSKDGKQLASASYDQTVKVWDATSGQETLTLKGHTSAVMHVTFSADGKRLASASADQTVKLWDLTTGQETLTLKGHNGAVMSVVFDADGNRLASAGEDATVKIWDAANGQELLTLRGHTDPVTSVVFNADGSRLASASGGLLTGSKPGEVKVWDATNGQETLILKGHTGPVSSVAFNQDGNRLASASHDGAIKVWDARPWTPELRVEREALNLIQFLREQGQPTEGWLAAIATDETISEPVRQRAMQFAREWK